MRDVLNNAQKRNAFENCFVPRSEFIILTRGNYLLINFYRDNFLTLILTIINEKSMSKKNNNNN